MEKPSVSTPGNSSDPRDKDESEDNAKASGNVDKIRDILFGNQMRDYEKRFSRVEERLVREASELREDVKRRLVSLENYVKSEIQALSDALKGEREERGEQLKEATREMKDQTKAVEKKLTHLEDLLAKGQRDIRQFLLEEINRLTEESEQKHAGLSRALTRESEELRSSLIDRMALADLFGEVAMRLKDEFKRPEQG